jgi:hypothetical protein
VRAALADDRWTPLARVHLIRMAPRTMTEAAAAVAGASDLYAFDADAMAPR